MMEFMRPLAVEKERRNDNTAAEPRVSQSVTQSLSHSVSHPSPPEPLPVITTTSTIINHSSQSCIHVARRVRTCASFEESVHEVIVTVELTVAYIAPPYCTNGSTARAAQTQTNHHNDKPNTAKEHSCVQQQVAESKKRWCFTLLDIKTYRILMSEKSAIESMMPLGRSPEAKKGEEGVQ